MKKSFIKRTLLVSGIILTLNNMMLESKSIATETYYENDVTPPQGRLTIVGATTESDGSYTVGSKDITVEVYATDDMCDESKIEYYVSTSEISKTTKIADNDWISLGTSNIVNIELKNEDTSNTIYAAFKDVNGNTSIIYTGTMQTVTYNANGGTLGTVPTSVTRTYGAPFVITSQYPSKGSSEFLGWSIDSSVNTPSYKAGDIIPADVVLSGGTSVTLYAIWKEATSVDDSTGSDGDEEETGVTLASQVSVGDYVDYPVEYSNVDAYSGWANMATLEGWRVLSVDGDTVNLVSAGVPLTYDVSFVSNSLEKYLRWDMKMLTQMFLHEYTTSRMSECGFASERLIEFFLNDYTESVRAMTKTDFDKVYGSTTTNGKVVTNNDLLALPCSDYPDEYAPYWLATMYGTAYCWLYNEDGTIEYCQESYERGIRPVVTLKSGIKTTGKVNGVWKLETL